MYPGLHGAAALAAAGGTLGAPLAPIPTIAWNIPVARRTAGVEGTYRWKPAR